LLFNFAVRFRGDELTRNNLSFCSNYYLWLQSIHNTHIGPLRIWSRRSFLYYHYSPWANTQYTKKKDASLLRLKEKKRMEKTQKYFISIPLCERARHDAMWTHDRIILSLSLLMLVYIRKIAFFFYLSPLSSLFFSLSLWVCSNDDSQVDEDDEKRWVDTFEQLIGRQDSLFALCLEQLSFPLSLFSD
jgi:hypothetical protein